MTYKEALDKIHSLNKFGSRPGLDRVKRLLSDMGNPQNDVRYIHVAGTNGKGSVCAMVSSVALTWKVAAGSRPRTSVRNSIHAISLLTVNIVYPLSGR